MPDQIQIRPAQPSDELAIQTCANLAYHGYVALMGQKPAPMVADFAALIAAGHVHVAESAHNVLGFIVFYQKSDGFMLENVAVRPDAAGQGIGKRLIAVCEMAAQRSGATSVHLYTNEKMTANLSIYPHLGYRETDRKTEDGFNRVYFEKSI